MQRHYKVSCTRNNDSSSATSRAHPPHPTARLVYWHYFESLLFACTRYDLRFDTFFPPDGGMLRRSRCVRVCLFIPFILQICRRTSRSHTEGKATQGYFNHLFCGACLNFYLEKSSAIPFPRRLWSRILLFVVRKNISSCDCTEIRTHVPTSQEQRSDF